MDRDGATVIDRIGESYPAQFTDISYGLDDAGAYRYFNAPTPGQANSTSGYTGFLEVGFSRQRGFESAPFTLELLASDAAATIRYTLDGTEPDETTGTVYSGPIAIDTTTIVRAHAYQSGYLSELPQTHSYVFPNDVVEQPWSIAGYPNPSYPVGGTGGSVTHDHQMDPAITQSPVYAADLISGLTEIPTVSLALAPSTLFGSSGFYDTEDQEKAVSMEILYADAPDQSHQVNAGIESHSRARLKRSMRINFRAEYGFSELESDILKRGPVNGDSATDSFKRLIVRAGNTRSWARNWNRDRTTFTIDQFYRDTQIAASGAGAHGNFVHLYINGIYWGLHNLVERPDSDFMAEYLGGDDDDWFFIKHESAGDGDKSRYQALESLLDKDLAVAANYETLQRHLNTGKYIDYILIAFYTALSDWPQNNFYGGNRNDSSALGATPFRFFAWDGEWSWDRQHQNVQSNPGGQARVHPMFKASASLDDSAPLVARIWHAARRNESFMSELRQRVDQMTGAGGALSDAAATTRWQTLNAYVRNAVVAESARWGDALQSLDGRTRTRDDDWQPAVDVMAGLIDGNAAALRQALASEGFY